MLSPNEWYRLVNEVRTLAERHNLESVQEALDFVAERSGLQKKDKNKVLYRDHRGSLEDSMKTVVTLPATRLALFNHMQEQFAGLWPFRIDDMVVRYYTDDWRVEGWAPTYLVTLKGQATGYTNGPVR
jgi:hypothetical protein